MAFSVSGIGRAAAAEAGFRCISVVDMIYIILFGQHPKKKSGSRTGSSLTGMLPLFFLGRTRREAPLAAHSRECEAFATRVLTNKKAPQKKSRTGSSLTGMEVIAKGAA